MVEEAGISGASRHNRPGLLELVDRIDEWDVLLCFDSSRLTRNGEDLGWIRNRLKLHGRRAYEVSTGLDLENPGAKDMRSFLRSPQVRPRSGDSRPIQESWRS